MTSILGWLLGAPLAMIFIGYGGAKLAGFAPMVAAFRSFGFGATPAPRIVVGVAEVIAGVALLIPSSRGVTALILLVGLSAGIGGVAWRRRRRDLGRLRAPMIPVAATLLALAVVATLGLH